MALPILTTPPFIASNKESNTGYIYDLIHRGTDKHLENLPDATYSLADNVRYLRTLLPPTWFVEDDVIRDAILATYADSMNDIQVRNDWSYEQSHLLTASGIWLDMYAEEFFGVGGWMYRRLGENDAAFRKRILFELLAPRATRSAMSSMLKFWCGGVDPIIIEPWNPNDTGVWDDPSCFYDTKGYWGSNEDPWTTFIITRRAGQIPMQQFNDETASDFLTRTPGIIEGNPISNTNYLYGGWDSGMLFWIDDLINESQVSDPELYGVVNRTKPAGTVAFIHLLDSSQLSNDPNAATLDLLNYDFTLNQSKLADISSVITLLGAPPGYVNTFLNLNFVLNKSHLGELDVVANAGVPTLEDNVIVIDSTFTVEPHQTA